MKYFCVPADFKKETIDKYAVLNSQYKDSKVIETFGVITVGNTLESGRSADLLPPIDIVGLKEYISYSKSKDIDFNYTLNGSTMYNREFTEEGIRKIKKFLKDLYDAGVRSLTVTLPSVIELVQSTGLDFKIKVSTICQINNANKALSYKKMGVERIVPEEAINRDFGTLKSIVDVFGDKVEVITNVVCHKECIYRLFHYNQMSSDSVNITSEASANYYSHKCMNRRYEDISNIMKLSWIRPEDIKCYTEIGINYFKLQGRQAVLKGDPVRVVESYFKESFDGNLMELLDMFSPTNSFTIYVDNKKLDGFIEPFFKQDNFCKHNCTACRYCESFARKAIDYDKAQEIVELSRKFYKEYDPYSKLLSVVNEESSSSIKKTDLNIDFDF